MEAAIERLSSWNFSTKIVNRIISLLYEWYSSTTLDRVLSEWEVNQCPLESRLIPFHLLSYNVQGWGSRSIEALEITFKTDSQVCVFTEVGELWNTFKFPHFNTLYQKGTNHSGGIMIMIGKHLKATRIETDIENTLIVDITGLSKPIRIIGIYWPQGQHRNLNDLKPHIIDGTILTGDFNATHSDWGSPATDSRGNKLRNWVESNSLWFIPSTKNSSKRSERHIDLLFSNLNDVRNETVQLGTSDHWPIVTSIEDIGFPSIGFFPHFDTTAYQITLVLLESFWMHLSTVAPADDWYLSYVRF